MKRSIWICVLAIAAALPARARDVVTPTELAPSDLERATLAGTFVDYRLYELDLEAVVAAARRGRLSLDLGHRRLDLELELNDLRSPTYRRYATRGDSASPVELGTPPVTTYRGRLADDPHSIVRLSIRGDRFRGYVRGGGDWIWFDRLADHIAGAAANRIVAYDAADVLVDAENARCGLTEAQHAVDFDFGFDAETLSSLPQNEAGLREWEVATEADGQWADRFGEQGGLDEIEDIINEVDGIYVAELDLTVNIAFQHIWTDLATDPFTSLDAGTTLSEFVDYWNDPPPGIRRNHPRRDMVHLFSAKDFNGGVIGIAFVGVVCINQNTDSNLSFGVSQDFGTDSQQIALVAHEMGHNWGAFHLNSPPCNQVCDGDDQIMCSFIQSNPDLSFADCTKDQINDHIDAFGDLCLSP